jgi:hypothetical protein
VTNARKVGSDEVHVESERVFIRAARAMDWPIREFCRMPIWFAGRKYYLRAKHTEAKSNRPVYELWPWPDDLHGGSTQGVIYDDAYVAERDRNAGTARRCHWAYLLLLPLYPVLGLFWSRFKNVVFVPMGFEIGSLTKVSVVFTFYLFFLHAIFAGWLQTGFLVLLISPSLQWLDWVLLLAMALDCAMRFGQTLKSDVTEHWGFCEWLVRPRSQ